MRKLNQFNSLALIGGFVCATIVAAAADHHEGEGDHDGGPEHEGPPPIVLLTPPEGAEKPEGVEMTGDPEQDWPVVLETFHSMMDADGSGDLSLDELASWAHPGPMHGPGPGPDGHMPDEAELRQHIEDEIRHRIHMEMQDEMMERHREQLEHMRHEIEEMRGHEARLNEEAQEVRQHIANMLEELRRGEEELAQGPEEEAGAPETE